MANKWQRVSADDEEGHWFIQDGTPTKRKAGDTYRPDGTVHLNYSNPYNLNVERVWFDGKTVFAIEQGEIDVPVDKVKLAQEYQLVYSVKLDSNGKLVGEPERVDGQFNIYDSVPGMDKYSPLWRFNYVIVPRDYEPNSFRSEQDCLASGYEIRQSTVIEN
ncbi:MAG: hypothetical protein ABI305_09265 [Tepidiformaceae bacterium]